MRRRPRAWPAAIGLAVAAVLAARGDAVGYRPFVSTDAAVADVGEAEIELGYAGFREDRHRITVVAPTFVGNLGVAPDVEVVGEFKLANDLTRPHDDPTRFADTAVSLKWVFRDGVLQEAGTRASLAVETSMLLPTLPAQDRPGGELVALMSGRTLGWTYHLNVGALVEPGANEPGVTWGIIAEHVIAGPLRAVAEVNGQSVRTTPPDDSALVGAAWTVRAPAPLHELTFDVGVRRGLSAASADWGGTAGLTFAFPWSRTRDEETTP